MIGRLVSVAAVVLAGALALASSGPDAAPAPVAVNAEPSGVPVPDDGCLGDPSPPASPADRIRNQDKLDEAVASVDENAPGFVEIRYDVVGAAAEIAWHGERPARLTRLAGRHASGVTVCIVSVRHSVAEIHTAMEVARAVDSYLPWPVMKGPADNYDGIVVGFLPAGFDRMNSDEILAQYRESAGMPVEFVVASGAVDT